MEYTTANAYVNERACGRGIKASGMKREDVFISTKLWPSEYENPNAVDETLDALLAEMQAELSLGFIE